MKIELQKLSSVAGAAEGIPCISHPIRCGVQTFGERSTKCAGYITMPFMEHASILENVASRPVEYVDTQTEGVHISSFDHLNIHSWNLAIKTYARQGSRLQALHLFQQLQQNGIIPDRHSFVYTLVACGEPGALGDGKRLHAHLCASQFRSDFVILTALVNMYGKHSRLKDASNCFDQITRRDVVAWATFIQLFSQQGYDIEAHQFCSQMLQEGILPDKVALMCILDAYTHMSNKQCTHIHVSALLNIEEEDVQISTALLSMLGKTNKLLNAIQLFDSMLTRNVLTWSAMISLLERAEQNERARQIFNDMLEQGTLPNEITFLNILSAYKNEKDLIAGHRLHARLAGSTCEMGLPLSNSLLNFYIKCSSLQDAVLLFQNLSKRDVISFTAMISLSVDDGDADNAFGFLNRMLSLGHTPDQVAFTSLLDACNILSDLDARNILHDFIVECSYDSEHILTNSLLNVYCKHGSLMEAHWIFMKMSVRDIISWNGIIGMHSQLGNMHDALQLLSRMEQEIIPDKVTFLNITICFTNFSALPHGKYIHTQLRAMNLVSELAVNTSLVSMYGRCGSLTLAQMIYSEVQEMDLVFWRELVTVNAINGQFCYIKSLFRRLLLECFIPDELCYVRIFSALCGQVVLLEVKKYHVLIMNTSFALDISMNNALLHMYGKCGCLKAAQEFFRRMVNKDSITWNTLLTICNLHSQGLQIIFILDEMCWEGYLPDVVTWTNRIIACVSSIDLSEGKRVHACLHYCKLDSECFVASALINMYGKCGDLDASRKMFDFLPCKNMVTWNSMIAVYALHGLGEEAIKLFNLMLSMRLLPDKATFASILAGCSHVGLHVEGCHILAFMKNHGISPSEDDFSCIIDLLGRLGRLDEAESLINDQVDSATVKSLRALLSACRHQRDVERGERAAKKLLAGEYPRGHKELRGTFFYMHGPQDTVSWFTQRGVILKAEEDGRMFPATDTSSTIIDCLLAEAQKLGVQLQTKSPVLEVSTRSDSKFKVSIGGIKSQRSPVESDYLLLATGGTQQGFKLAKELGHSIVDPCPSLFSFKVADLQLQELAGISFPLVRAELQVEGQKHKNPSLTQVGPMLITHWGLSGPVILRLSAWGARDLFTSNYKGMLWVDFAPKLSLEEVARILDAQRKCAARKKLGSFAPDKLPLVRRFWEYLLMRMEINPDSLWGALNNSSSKKLSDLIKRFPFHIDGKGEFKEEFVTSGGVPLAEVDLKSMESRLCPNLYLAGEVLNVDGITGGFNFQNAWTGGYIAGTSIGLRSKQKL